MRKCTHVGKEPRGVREHGAIHVAHMCRSCATCTMLAADREAPIATESRLETCWTSAADINWASSLASFRTRSMFPHALTASCSVSDRTCWCRAVTDARSRGELRSLTAGEAPALGDRQAGSPPAPGPGASGGETTGEPWPATPRAELAVRGFAVSPPYTGRPTTRIGTCGWVRAQEAEGGNSQRPNASGKHANHTVRTRQTASRRLSWAQLQSETAPETGAVRRGSPRDTCC